MTYEEGTVFRNVGTENSADAGESPKR